MAHSNKKNLSVIVCSFCATTGLSVMVPALGVEPSTPPMETAATWDEGGGSLNFDSGFLSLGKDGAQDEKHIDLAYFAHKGGMAPGDYAVQVKVNGKLVDEGRIVTFKSWPASPGKLYACVMPEDMLAWWGIKASRRNDTVVNAAAHIDLPDTPSHDTPAALNDERGGQCPVGGVVSMVPYAQESFDFNNRILSLTVPQASLGPASRFRTPPHLWNSGLPAVLMNYNYTGSQQNNRGQKRGSDFVGINGQLNLLGWRLRSDLTGHKRQGSAAEWTASQWYAQHDFAYMGGGQLTLGHTASSGGAVDSVSFVGAKVDSDAGMLSPALASYTPAITGIAESPATVTARQYGRVIFQQNVPQGPFSLTDFNRSGSGEVDVEVREADGRTRHYTLAQAGNSVLMRQGMGSYSTSLGQASNGAGYVDERFVQAGGSYGVGANTTLTGGVLLSRDYQAMAAGAGFYAGAWGAFSYTLKGNRANLASVPGNAGTAYGVAHDVGWSRSFGNTAVGISYSRGQTPNARSYTDMLSMKPLQADERAAKRTGGNRDSLGVSLSQSLGQWGSLSLNGTRTTAWGGRSVQQSATLGFSTSVKDIGLGLAFGISSASAHEHDQCDDDRMQGRTDRTVSLTVSLPLGKWLGSDRISSGNYSYTRTNGTVNQQVGLSGSAMDGALSYSASQTLTDNRAGSISMGFGGHYGAVSGGYSYGPGSHSVSYGVNGGVALHPQGATLGRSLSLGGGNALVEIPGAGGIKVGDAVTDWRGYALVSGLTPYDHNHINVDMSRLPGNMELDTSSKNVVPTRGALVSVPFRSNKGYRLLLDLKHDGSSVPFGASVTLKQKDRTALPLSGLIGEAGRAYLAGMPATGTVVANWGDAANEQCTATYALPATADMSRLIVTSAICR